MSRDTTRHDTTSTPPIKSIVATNKARAFYHLANQSKIKDKPAINYVRGRVIDIAFENRVVQLVTVTDQASGVYLEVPEDTTTHAPPPKKKPAAQPKTPKRRSGRIF